MQRFVKPINTYKGNDIFPSDFVSIGESINSAFVEFGYLTNNNAVSMPGFFSTLKLIIKFYKIISGQKNSEAFLTFSPPPSISMDVWTSNYDDHRYGGWRSYAKYVYGDILSGQYVEKVLKFKKKKTSLPVGRFRMNNNNIWYFVMLTHHYTIQVIWMYQH